MGTTTPTHYSQAQNSTILATNRPIPLAVLWTEVQLSTRSQVCTHRSNTRSTTLSLKKNPQITRLLRITRPKFDRIIIRLPRLLLPSTVSTLLRRAQVLSQNT